MANTFLDKFKYLFYSPNEFFNKVSGEGIRNAIFIYIAVLLISQILAVFNYFFLRPYWALSYGLLGFTASWVFYNPFYILFYFIIQILLIFAYAGVILLLVKLFKGTGGYTDSFKAVAYSMLPFYIFSLIPFIGWLSIFYSLALMVFGVKNLHGLSTGKAIATIIIPVFVVLAILLFLALLVLSMFYGFV